MEFCCSNQPVNRSIQGSSKLDWDDAARSPDQEAHSASCVWARRQANRNHNTTHGNLLDACNDQPDGGTNSIVIERAGRSD
jgi:hypothetical protein